jgi:hypothetical protein
MSKFKAGRTPKPGRYSLVPAGYKLDDYANQPDPLCTVDPREFVEPGRTSWPGWLFIAIPPNQLVTATRIGRAIGSKLSRFRGEPVQAEKDKRTKMVKTLRETKSLRETEKAMGIPRRTILKEQAKPGAD